MTHTPGPWQLNRDRVSVAIPYRGEHCVTSTYGGTEANAYLIAAAPDLLAALEALVDKSTDTEGDWSNEWRAALNAIAKARSTPVPQGGDL